MDTAESPRPAVPAVPALAAGTALYLALFGAAQVLWLQLNQTSPRAAAAMVGAAPVIITALLAWGWRADAPGYRTRLLACGALSPLLQLLWLQSQPLHLPPVVTALHALLGLACHAAAVTLVMDRLGLGLQTPRYDASASLPRSVSALPASTT